MQVLLLDTESKLCEKWGRRWQGLRAWLLVTAAFNRKPASTTVL